MKKRAEEIFHKEVLTILTSKSKKEFANSLIRLAQLADILDQTGDEVSANKLDELLKQAGIWGDLFSGMAGGGGAKLWDAIKGGRLKDSLGEIAKGALMGAGAGVVADLLIKWLDDVPFIGSYLKELAGADKLRSLLIGVIGTAVAESDVANKLVDQTILAIEKMIGFGPGAKASEPAKQEQPKSVKPKAQEPPAEKDEGGDTAQFQVAAKLKNV